MRLIDANALIKRQRIGDISVGLEYILAAPTIDAVPVVRCKDCIYGDIEENSFFGDGSPIYCCQHDYGLCGSCRGNFFCCFGERKEQ